MTVTEAIKRAIKLKGCTQAELAERIGTKQNNVAMYLKSCNAMKVENMLRMLNACGFDLVVIDRENAKNAFVIGDEDDVPDIGCDPLDDRIRRIVEEVLTQREGTPGTEK